MAWTNTRTWAFADVLTVDRAQAYLADNQDELRAGGLAITSQAAGQFIVASTATQLQSNSLFTTTSVARKTAAETVTDTWTFSDSVIVSSGTLSVPDGTAAAPSITFGSDADTGIYRFGDDVIGFSAGGTVRMNILETRVDLSVPINASAGTAAAPGLYFGSDSDTGLYQFDDDILGVTVGGTVRVNFLDTRVDLAVPINASAGTASAPGIVFGSDLDTGIWHAAADRIDFATGGTNRMSILSSGVAFSAGIAVTGAITGTSFSGNSVDVAVGTALVPSISFTADSNTGIYQSEANSLDITCGGTNQLSVNASGVVVSEAIELNGPVRKASTIEVVLNGGTINNWNPTGLSGANRIRCLITANTTITGIEAQPDGTEIILYDPGAGLGFTATFPNMSTGSLTANRVRNHRNDDWKLGAEGNANSRAIRLIYDDDSGHWINLESGLPEPSA